MTAYAMICVFSMLGTLFVGGSILFSKLIAAESKDTQKKMQPYESGMDAIGSARIQFKVGYYLFALIFMVFDVEALFLFPCLAIFRDSADGKELGTTANALLIEVGLFVLILFVGLIYCRRKKVLEWE